MSKTRNYCGISRLPRTFSGDCPTGKFTQHPDKGSLLGDKIQSSLLYGADLGSTVTPQFDEDVQDDAPTHDVDVLGSPNHDFYDIAEKFGEMIEAQAGPIDIDME